VAAFPTDYVPITEKTAAKKRKADDGSDPKAVPSNDEFLSALKAEGVGSIS
jgi:hypothetical protein